jgi:hypothetical protein
MNIRFIKTVYCDHSGMFVGQRRPQREIVDWVYDGTEEMPVYSEESHPDRTPVRFAKGQIVNASDASARKYISLGWAEPA